MQKMLTATINGRKFAILRHEAKLNRPAQAQELLASWRTFYAMAEVHLEDDDFNHNLPGYSEFYDEVDAWVAQNGGRPIVPRVYADQHV